MAEQPQDNRYYTEAGRVIKHADRMEQISTRKARKITFFAHTWEVSRIVRRDLNLTLYRIFWEWNHPNRRDEIMDAIEELRAAAFLLDDAAFRFEKPEPTVLHDTIPLRVVSPRCREIVDALEIADRALHKMRPNLDESVYRADVYRLTSAFSKIKKVAGLSTKPPPSLFARVREHILRFLSRFKPDLRR